MQDQRDRKWDELRTYLAVEALKVLGEPLVKEIHVYKDLKRFTKMELLWWQGVLTIDARSRKRINSAIRRFVRTGCWPTMANSERCVISLRLRLAARIARSLRGVAPAKRKAWFPATIRALPHKDILRWLLLDAWEMFGAEIFDESAEWADQVGGILYPRFRVLPKPPAGSSTADSLANLN